MSLDEQGQQKDYTEKLHGAAPAGALLQSLQIQTNTKANKKAEKLSW